MQPVTHVLLDYENVQPSEMELRTLVPAATKVWVFHGPHQKQVESRFASFGPDMTAVPISKTGKNALDFHLSFYMGYIVSRNQQAKVVVVANDKGYKPMLEHAKQMGFSVRQVGYGPAAAKPGSSSQPRVAATVPTPTAKKVARGTTTAKTAAAGKQVAAKNVAAKKAPAKQTTQPLSKKARKGAAPAIALAADPSAVVSGGVAVSPALVHRIVESLRKMETKRPAKIASLRRALKPLLGVAASEEAINIALNRLIPMGIVAAGSNGEVSYPGLA